MGSGNIPLNSPSGRVRPYQPVKTQYGRGLTAKLKSYWLPTSFYHAYLDLTTPPRHQRGERSKKQALSCLCGSTDPYKSHQKKIVTEFIGYKVFGWMKFYHHLYSDLDEWCTGFYMKTHFTPFALLVLLSFFCLFRCLDSIFKYLKLNTKVRHGYKDITLVKE